MTKREYLGNFELVVMLALIRLGEITGCPLHVKSKREAGGEFPWAASTRRLSDSKLKVWCRRN
jgi:hypothetical protein